MRRPSRSTTLRTTLGQRCIALCAAVLLALTPMNATAFAGSDPPGGAESVEESEGVQEPRAPEEAKDASSAEDAEKPSDRSEMQSGAAGAVAAGGGSARDGSSDASDNLTLSLKWLNAPAGQEQDMSWSDPTNLTNPTQTITYRLGISSSHTGYEAGDLSVRLPLSLWNNRFGRPINPQSLGIPQAPNAGSAAIPFNYTVDTATNELVITNTGSVPAASNFEIDVQYTAIPWNTVSGSKAVLAARATGTTSAGSVNRADSNTITYTIETDVRTENVLKTDGKPMYFWDSSYTGGKPQPADFSNYRWVTWRVVMGGAANQPYSVTLNDLPGQGGEVYAISDGDLYYHELLASDFTLHADGSITSKVFDDPTVRGPASAPIEPGGVGNCIRVLVRYPKTGGDVLANAVQATLTGVDSRVPHATSSEASMDWKDFEFTYDGDPLSMVKFTGDYESQNKMVNTELSLLERGVDVALNWGMRMTGNVYPGVNYLGQSYQGEMTDDVIYWTPLENASTPAQAETLMTPGDYQYQSARIYATAYQVDRSNGQNIYFDQNSPDAAKITVWAMTDEAGGFQETASFYASELSYKGAPASQYKEVAFPAGTIRAKVTFENAVDYLYLRMDPTIQVKASSPTLRSWFDQAAAAGKDLTALRVQNFNYYKVFSENNIPLLPTPADYRFDGSYIDNALLAAHDRAAYGTLLNRSSAGITLAGFVGASQTLKYASNPSNDSVGQAVNIEYWLHGRDWYDMSQSEYNELRASGWPSPARDSAVFYDLLPRGMVYDARWYPIAYDINGLPYTSDMDVRTIDNYRGTERQMVVFTITSKTPGTNVSTGTEVRIPNPNPDGTVGMVVLGYQPPGAAGFTVRFHATVPWNKVSFANQDTNLAAFQVPENDQLRGQGHADNGDAPIVRDVRGDDGRPVFADLRGNGIDESIMDTKYMTLQKSINVPIALGSGLVKHVRSDSAAIMDPFVRNAATSPGGGYTYKLTTNVDSISKMKDLVLFDILEEAQNTGGAAGETSWKGVLDSVDASDARIIGIEPRVYYSTTTDLAYDSLDVTDLDDPSIWSMTEPADRASITAVAVDLRYRADGSEYVFEPSTGTSILMHMKAPNDLPDQQYAFNRAAYYSTLLDPSGSEKTELNVGDRTTVGIHGIPAFAKASDPAGGTTADDAVSVQPGQEITYRLTFDPMRVNARGIVVKDMVPAGLGLVPGSIAFTPAGSSTSQPVSDAAYDAATGELTWPAYDQAAAGAASFQFKVAVRPFESGASYLLYANKARAAIGEEPPLDSNVITHKQMSRWIEVSKTAALVEGIAPDDPDAAHGGTVLGEASGTAAAPVAAALSQIIEYHLVVKNTGAQQMSGQIDVEDAVPAGTAYVPGSATVMFRSSANPAQPVPGSAANGAVVEPTAADVRVGWKLDKLSDGEEAYLTFRVSTPSTAFSAGQAGMWAEKMFVNEAQVTDQGKNETKTTESTYHRVQEARITATKQWDDADNYDGIRPQSVQVQLYADGVATGSPVTLSQDNGWSHAWTGLAASSGESGQHIVYSVQETRKVSCYEPPVYTVDPDDASLVTITNARIPGTPVFSKTSDPLGGAFADDAVAVQPGQEITYTLTFDAKRLAQNIVVTDFVPAGLDLVPGSITFLPAGSSVAQIVGDDAYDAATGRLTWPAYDQVMRGPATFQFKVTAHPLEGEVDYRLYENEAQAAIGEEPPIDSNVVTHQQLNRWADVTKTAALVEGVSPQDGDAAHGGTALPEERGTAAAPVSTGLDQIVEYRLVVKNTGVDQKSGRLDVTDAIPAGTVYIPGSADVSFRSSADPTQQVPDSTASGMVQEPTEGNDSVSWQLDGLADGEEAYLTFRVGSPTTAFASGQTGMWAEKTFANKAQMTDVGKGETKATESTYHRVQEARITATKQWDDAENRDGIRPQSVQVQLFGNGAALGDPVTLDEDNGWSHTWTGLAALDDEAGEQVVYTVAETPSVPGYDEPVYTVDPDDASLTTIVNRHVPGEPTFVKMSDPVGGSSADNAATVQPGQEIAYTLAYNSAKAHAKNIVVKDFVPAGLNLVPGSITFTPSGIVTPQPVGDEAYNEATRELTWPAYDQVSPGIARFQFRATAVPLENGTDYRLYENKATATVDGEPPLDSNTVTHQQQNRWAEVAKTAALVEGITADDPAAAYGGEVAGENAGTDVVPVEAGLAQIVEYHLVVKNAGVGQTSGELDVRDAIPAGTAFIPGSATATFRSSANPEAPVPGSVAVATIEQPTADKPEILWKLDQMSDGEEAYLTFRVSAPVTAFEPGQPGMWAEKRFENAAQMIDLAKGETKQTETTHHRVQEAKITATKQWDDADNRDGIRPQSIQVQLYADGVAVGSPVTLDEGVGWMHAWTGLAATNADTGAPLHYTVEETQAVSGYEKPVYTVDAADVSLVTIVNKHVPKSPEPPAPTTPSKPTGSTASSGYGGKGTAATGDQMPLALLGMAAAASAVVLAGVGARFLRKRRQGK